MPNRHTCSHPRPAMTPSLHSILAGNRETAGIVWPSRRCTGSDIATVQTFHDPDAATFGWPWERRLASSRGAFAGIKVDPQRIGRIGHASRLALMIYPLDFE